VQCETPVTVLQKCSYLPIYLAVFEVFVTCNMKASLFSDQPLSHGFPSPSILANYVNVCCLCTEVLINYKFLFYCCVFW